MGVETYVLQGLAALAGALALAVALLAVKLGRAARSQRELRTEIERTQESSQQLIVPLRRMERDLEFVTEWVRGFPQLMIRFGGCHQMREIPEVLVEGMVRTFHAEQAVVVLRRRSTLHDPDRGQRLIVAAVARPEPGLEVGAEIPIGEGQLGHAAATLRAFDQEELPEDGGVREILRRTPHQPLDGVAPMVVGTNLLGVIGFALPARHVPRALDMLQAIAHLGALSLHNLWTYRRARVAADTDDLTGTLNKGALRFRLSEHVFTAGETGDTVAVFMFDLDHFKHYNDHNGHVAGDEALRLVARIAAETVRADDIFGRFGGEEFLLILPGRDRAEAAVAAESIRRAIESFDFPFGAGQPLGQLTISGGVAVFPDDADDSMELLRAADRALYRAKEAGRNRIDSAPLGPPTSAAGDAPEETPAARPRTG